MYNIDFRYLITILLAVILRKPRQIAWIRLLLSHLNSIYKLFKTFRNNIQADIIFTGQVMYLEKKLQIEICDGITVTDGYQNIPVYLSNIEEANAPVFFGNLWELGVIYQVDDEIIYLNYWYQYIGVGNGNSPDSDPNAVQGDEIDTYMYNNEESTTMAVFYVNIPQLCYDTLTSDDLNRLNSIVEYYLIAGAGYEIKVM